MPEVERTITVAANVPYATARKLKLIAAAMDKKMADIHAQAIQEFAERHGETIKDHALNALA